MRVEPRRKRAGRIIRNLTRPSFFLVGAASHPQILSLEVVPFKGGRSVFGSNLRSIHYLDNCPTLLAGGGAGIKLGQNIAMPKGTPLCNVWLTLLKGTGIDVESHGDSTGVVRELVG
jgi:hypothetical protein